MSIGRFPRSARNSANLITYLLQIDWEELAAPRIARSSQNSSNTDFQTLFDEFGLLHGVPGEAKIHQILISKRRKNFGYSLEYQEQPELIKYSSSNLMIFWLIPGLSGAHTNHQIFISKYLLMRSDCSPTCHQQPKLVKYKCLMTFLMSFDCSPEC